MKKAAETFCMEGGAEPGMLAAASSAQAPLPEKVGILDREARYRNTGITNQTLESKWK